MDDIESDFYVKIPPLRSYKMVMVPPTKLDEMKAEISRLQEQNAKLREALVSERAKYNALSGWYLDEDAYGRLSDDRSGNGEIPGKQFFKDEAEQELRAEGLIE